MCSYVVFTSKALKSMSPRLLPPGPSVRLADALPPALVNNPSGEMISGPAHTPTAHAAHFDDRPSSQRHFGAFLFFDLTFAG